FKEQNGFVCPRCEQYNGFTEDGGYNKDLPEQRMEYMNKYISPTKKKRSFLNGSIHAAAGNQPTGLPSILSHNGLCHQCNAQQNLIQALINKFEPKNENEYLKCICGKCPGWVV
ncbi:unnamed protein product, partial [Anisakis simplex]|uniref:Transmembrane protein 201 (inferred by orthology to a human protein) n=1 Tax=Anisakis simplex TaxID=6269 RepID=A0A0M3J9X4_ANISI